MILAIVNQKGGVGKTTTAINLAAALGALEQKVLVVDCDPQGNATRGFGEQADSPNLYDALTGECSLRESIRATQFPFVDLVGADRDLVGVEVEFVGQKGWETKLREVLAQVRDDYWAILLDCPPSLGHLTINALTASDKILIPLQCEYFALEGMSELIATVGRIQEGLNQDLDLAGILLTMYDDRTKLSREVVDEVRTHFPGKVYETIVPRNVRLAEAPSHGQPVIQYDIRSRGAQAYLSLAREFLQRAGGAAA